MKWATFIAKSKKYYEFSIWTDLNWNVFICRLIAHFLFINIFWYYIVVSKLKYSNFRVTNTIILASQKISSPENTKRNVYRKLYFRPVF